MKTLIEIASPILCVAPLFVMFVFDRWAARIDSSEVDE